MAICKQCGGEIPENSSFCNLCGAKVETEGSEENNLDNNKVDIISSKLKINIPKNLKIGIIALFGILVLGGIGFGIHRSVETNSVPSCDSEFAKNAVLNIFRQNNYTYSDMMRKSLISSLDLTMIEPISYDKELKKYTCSARVVLYPNKSIVMGVPKMLWITSRRYRVGLFYEYATCDVNYSIYKEHGEDALSSTYCQNKSLQYKNLINGTDAFDL